MEAMFSLCKPSQMGPSKPSKMHQPIQHAKLCKSFSKNIVNLSSYSNVAARKNSSRKCSHALHAVESELHGSEGDLDERMTFTDEGGSVEVRVKLPENYGPIQTSQISVTIHEDSLLIAITTDEKLIPLLVANPLYSQVIPSNTIWFRDESEVVVVLEKLKSEETVETSNFNAAFGSKPNSKATFWPSLVQSLPSLSRGLSSLLQSCSVNIVGGDSEANWAVAKALATSMEYIPLSTQQLVETVSGKSIPEIIEEEGVDSVVESEVAVLESLTTNVRCLVGTIGGPHGAAASSDDTKWRNLHSGITVWLASTNVGSDSASPYARADVKVVFELPEGKWDDSATIPVAEGVLKAVKNLLDNDPEFTKKKGLYLRMGCRGDWPNIMPPSWNPDEPAVQD